MKRKLLFLFLLISCVSKPISIYAQLSGNYVIGKNRVAPYTSIELVFSELMSKGVSGSVVLLLEDKEYDIQSLQVGKIAGSNPTNTITIRPAPPADVTITTSKASSMICFKGTDNLIIDGCYDKTDTTKHLHFVAKDKITSPLIVFNAEQEEGGSSNIAIKNCSFYGNYETTGFTIVSSLSLHEKFIIENNHFFKLRYAISASGITGLELAGNQFINMGYTAVYISNTSNLEVSNNYLSNNKIALSLAVIDGCSIVSNRIIGGEKANVGIACMGMHNTLLANNLVLGDLNMGIKTDNGCKLYYNTISLHPGHLSTGMPSFLEHNSCIYVERTTDDLAESEIRNNICELDESSCTPPEPGYIFFCQAASFVENNNQYYCPSSSYFLNTPSLFKTFNEWIDAGFSRGSVSKFKKPDFFSSINCHLTAPNHLGTPIPEITTDIEGNPRNPLHPDAGAYEYMGGIAVSPDFTYQNTCQPIVFTLGNASSFTSASWDFGDGQTSTSSSPSHIYTVTGTYTVSLTATSTSGQVQKVSKTVSVYARPTPPNIKISGGK